MSALRERAQTVCALEQRGEMMLLDGGREGVSFGSVLMDFACETAARSTSKTHRKIRLLRMAKH